MRCPKPPLKGEVQQTQVPQQLGLGFFCPPCPPQPSFNPSPYHMAGSILPQSQFPLQIPGQAERSTWFQELVAAVSKQIKDGEKSAAEGYGSKTNVGPGNLSVEDEEALIEALEKQKKGRITMEQAFRELDQVCSSHVGARKSSTWLLISARL